MAASLSGERNVAVGGIPAADDEGARADVKKDDDAGDGDVDCCTAARSQRNMLPVMVAAATCPLEKSTST